MSAAGRFVHYFSDPVPTGCSDVRALLGGKGASLKEMSLAGLAVPPGFTISTDCCVQYYARNGTWPAGLESEVRDNLSRLEAETGRRFGQGASPLLVSVRSGAAVSMPGMMDTLLNCGLHPDLGAAATDAPAFWRLYIQFIRTFARIVHGLEPASFELETHGARPRTVADRDLAFLYLQTYEAKTGEAFPRDPWQLLVRCVNAVFDSWNCERAVAYRRRNGIRGLNGTAVNVQAMFPSQVSGVVFTRDPNEGPASECMVIEASFGLGESVVSGDVTPDRYLLRRSDGAVDARIGHKHTRVLALGDTSLHDPDAPCLNEPQLRELAGLALRVETHFGYPVDVEFGWAGGRFALLQSRAVRGLEVAEDVEIARQEEIFHLRQLAGERHRCWVIHNLDETLQAPTPLTWDIVRRFMSGSGGFGRMYRDLGHQPSRRVCEEGFLELVGGRIYADPERLAGLFWDAMPLRYDVDELLRDRSLLDRAPRRFDADRADGRFLARLPATVCRMIGASRLLKRASADARRHFEKDVLPPYLEYVARERGRSLAGLSDAEVVRELDARRARVLDEFGPESLKPGFFGGLAYAALADRLASILGAGHADEAARALTRALEGDTTFEQDAMLQAVAEGRASLERFLDAFGHRCVGEMELATPRWREDRTYIEGVVARLRNGGRERSLAETHRENVRQRLDAEEALPALLERFGGSVFLEPVLDDLRAAQALLPYRESGKHYLMMGYELIRLASEELGRRWDIGDGVYYLRLAELETFATHRNELAEEIRRRRIRRKALQRLDMPEVIDSRRLEKLGLAQEVAGGSELAGVAVASGIAAGTARIVADLSNVGNLGPDYVLVCPSTDPGWTPLFVHARGLIVERGGVLSHGAIVARDFGIPAVVLPRATRLIADGARIRIDGNTGRITLLEEAARSDGSAH